MKIELYLDGHQVEIDNDIDFVLNKQYTNLTDLTSIIVDYSKTIKVPMTPHNNELFNYIYKLEHQVLIGQDIINYDPSQKIPMTMTFNGSLVMDGYAVLNSVDLNEKKYEINIYGQLGKIFSELKEKTFKNYHKAVNGMFYSGGQEGVKMNTRTIAQSFQNQAHSLDWESTDWTDFYGFAPQVYGKTDNIDTKGYEVYNGGGQIKSFADEINTTRSIDYADNYIGDGLDFNQYAELRTYMTRPYVYVDKIIQLVKHEISVGDYDGYTLTLDQDWFNENNPYYSKLCYFPGEESIVDNGDSMNGHVTWNNAERSVFFPNYYLPTVSSSDLDGFTYTTDGYYISITQTGSDLPVTISLNCDGITVRDRITGVGSSGSNSSIKWAYYNLPVMSNVPIRYIGIYDENDMLQAKLYLCDDEIVSVRKEGGLFGSWSMMRSGGMWSSIKKNNPKIYVPNSTTWVNNFVSGDYCEVVQVYNFGNIVLNTNKFIFKIGCDVIGLYSGSVVEEDISWGNYHTLCPFKNSKYKNAVWSDGSTYSGYFRPVPSLEITSNTYRSGSRWTINDILGNDFNPFTWLIDYAKKFRLFFDIDYKTKVINLKGGYFNTVEYKQVTVDYSKGVKIEPVVDKYNKILYGYKGNNIKKDTQYMKSYGVEYGDMEIKTGIDVNNEQLKLTPNEDEGVFIPSSLNALTYSNLNSTSQIKYGNEIQINKIINTLDKDGKIAYFPFYAFRLPNYRNPIQPQVPFYCISDDTPNQRNTGKYTYLDHKTYNNSGWNTEVEDTVDGTNVYYLLWSPSLPQFDNYIPVEVELWNTIIVPTRGLRSGGVEEDDSPTNETVEGTEAEVISSSYIDPVTGQRRTIRRSTTRSVEEWEDEVDLGAETFLFWTTFGVPSEVYNGYVPSYLDSYCIYNRWKNYLNEIFNINNKKVTCYVRMSYPEFIDFKFNQLFVIDNCVFLVNKICDFNPNSTEPTKVELIQISDVDNLK